MLLRETIRAEFAWEGSLRDICVPDVDIDRWQATMKALEAHGHSGKMTVGGAASPMPGDIAKLFAHADATSAHWSMEVAGVVVSCHFFDRSEIEFDLDPREVKGQSEIDGLLES